jgi:hypothetical protein
MAFTVKQNIFLSNDDDMKLLFRHSTLTKYIQQPYE